MIKRILITLIVLMVLILPCVPVGAQGTTVLFDVIQVSPVGATVRATINGQVGDIRVVILDIDDVLAGKKPEDCITHIIKKSEINQITNTTIEKQIPIIGERDTTLEDYINSQIDETGESKVDISPLKNKYNDKDLIKNIPEIKYYPLKTTDVIGYDTKYEKKEVKTELYKSDAIKFGLNLTIDEPTVIDINVTTGMLDNKYGSKGVLAIVIDGVYYYDMSNSSWWDDEWEHRVKITFDNDDCTDDYLTDFPVLINVSEAIDGFDYDDCQQDLGDLRFVDADGVTNLAYEIDTLNLTGTSPVWVKIPELDNTNTDFITMYWGNSTCADGWNITGTWNSGYVAVYHMNDVTTSTIFDSTANDNDGVKRSANNPEQVTGNIGKAQDFYQDFINIGSGSSFDYRDNWTYEFYGNTQEYLDSEHYYLYRNGSPGATSSFTSGYNTSQNNGRLSASISSSTYEAIGTSAIPVDTYFNMTAVRNGANGYIYRNGVDNTESETIVEGQLDIKSGDAILGAHTFEPNIQYTWDGLMDEFRVSNIARSADWIKATYLTETSATFATFGSTGTLTVTTNSETDIGDFSVTLNGEITDIGNSQATVRGFEYGKVSGALDLDWHETGDFINGTFSNNITELDTNTTYYFRAYATDSTGTAYGDEDSFATTLALPLAPTDLTITQIGTNSIQIDWVKGSYADTTIIRASTDRYPSSLTDGFEIYNDTGTSTTTDGMDLGTSSYYIKAWSYNATGYSTDATTKDIGGTSMIYLFLLALPAVIGYFAKNNSYWIFKVFTGFAFLPLGFYLNANPITDDTNIRTIQWMVILGCVLACFFWAFWTNKRDSKGLETGSGRLRLPFMRTDEQEEEYQRSRYSPNRTERNNAYSDRISNARIGRRIIKRY